MSEQPTTAPRGNPPNRDLLAQRLGERLALWNEIRETVVEIGATWKWAYSEATHAWNYRSYLAGDRFFAAMTLTDGGFEVSLNVKTDEWAAVTAGSADEQAQLDTLKSQALAKGEDPAWIHLPVTSAADLPLLAKLLVARARRPQKPRLKGSKKR
ncbi:MAG TPA: DUF3788 family protein [Stenomitos sp.]